MAIYTPVIVEENIIGDTPVLIREDSASDGMALLLNTIAQTKYVLTGIKVWSSEPSQLTNPLTISRIPADGNVKTKVFTPELDNYQYQNKIEVNTEGFELDQFAKIDYTIEPQTVLRMTFVTFTSKELSLAKMLDELTGEYGVLEDVKEEMQFNEFGEVSDFYSPPIDEKYTESETLDYIPKQLIDVDSSLIESIKKDVFSRLVKSQKAEKEGEKKPSLNLVFDENIVVLLAIVSPILLLAGGRKVKEILKM
jgi:hypothetical protein